jgi:hypothetical protein
MVRFRGGGGGEIISLLQNVQKGYGAQPVTYSTGTGVVFLGGKEYRE